MRIEAHDRLGRPVILQVTRLVVYDAQNNPVAATVELGPNHCWTGHWEDSEFADMLRLLGINRTTLVTYLDDKGQPESAGS